MRVLPFAVVLAALVTCAPAPLNPPQLAVPRSFLGYTQCTEVIDPVTRRHRIEPVSWLNERIYDDRAEADVTIAHERVHQAQMKRFNRCRDAYEWYGANTIAAEAEAFCESARVFAKAKPKETTLAGAVYKYAHWLKQYQLGTNHADAIAAIQEFCGE